MLKFAEIFKVIQRRRSHAADGTTEVSPEPQVPDRPMDALAEDDTEALLEELRASGDDLSFEPDDLSAPPEAALDLHEAAELLGEVEAADAGPEPMELPGTEAPLEPSAEAEAETEMELELDSGTLDDGLDALGDQDVDLASLAAEIGGDDGDVELGDLIEEVRDSIQPRMGSDLLEGGEATESAEATAPAAQADLVGPEDQESDLYEAVSELDAQASPPEDEAVGIEALLSDDPDELGGGPSAGEGVDESALSTAMQGMDDAGEGESSEIDLEALAPDEPQEVAPGAPGFIRQMADMISPEEPPAETEAEAEAPEQELSEAERLQMDVNEAARLLEIDETEASLAVGDGNVEDAELMKQVREEADRLAERMDADYEDETPLSQEPTEPHVAAAAAAGGDGQAPAAAPASGRLHGGVARFLYATNYVFEKLNVSQDLRDTLGLAFVAGMAAVVLVIVAIVLKLHFFG